MVTAEPAESRQIARAADVHQRLVALEIGFQRHRRCKLAAVYELRGGLVNPGVYRFEEMVWQEEILNLAERVIVDQNRAQKGLFGLDIVG